MLETRVTKLLGIRYPIFQGGMAWISRAELVAAVSEAGGLGVLATGTLRPTELKDELRKVRAATDKPFAVNVSLVPAHPDADAKTAAIMTELALEEGVRIFTISAGSPGVMTEKLKKRGAIVIHVVPSARLAKKAEAAGVDAVVAEGYEAGGHVGHDEHTSVVLWPSAVRAVKIPVIAAGGIADGAGMAAALAFGAEGVQLGTRFIATAECNAHAVFKQRIVDAPETPTTVYCKSTHPGRALVTPLVDKLVAMEKHGASGEELERLRGRGRSRAGCLDGDLDEGILPCGAAAGLVTRVVTVAEVVRELVEGYSAAKARMP
ncbi:MAG: nitronate monooxygenase [Deltaproteobacteria bacterium]|nr:nitronate monooxygenase [Deltaproteobacteria bacterium]